MVIFTYGTTFTGAGDDVEQAGKILVSILKQNIMYEHKIRDADDPSSFVVCKGFWFHVNGALSAAYFLEMAHKKCLTDVKSHSAFDFRLDFIMSIVTSGHKWIGVPWPQWGVHHQEWVATVTPKCDFVHEMHATDLSISVSCNAQSSILLWSFISKNSYMQCSGSECVAMFKGSVVCNTKSEGTEGI